MLNTGQLRCKLLVHIFQKMTVAEEQSKIATQREVFDLK